MVYQGKDDYAAFAPFLDFTRFQEDISFRSPLAKKYNSDSHSFRSYANLTHMHLVDVGEVVERMQTLEGKVVAEIILTHDAEHPGFEAAQEIVRAGYAMGPGLEKFYKDFGIEPEC